MDRKRHEPKYRRHQEEILAIVRENLEKLKLMGKVPKRIFRTEVLDENTCAHCRAGNGKSWKTFEEIDWLPGDDCDDGLDCRGGYTADFLGEEEGQVVKS